MRLLLQIICVILLYNTVTYILCTKNIVICTEKEDKRMKKTLSAVLALIMCLSALSLCVFAADAPETGTATAKQPVVLSGSALNSAIYKVPETATNSFDADGGYVRLTGVKTEKNASQIYFNLPNMVSGADYPIMVIKYRYDRSYEEAGLSIFRSEFKAIDTNHDNVEVTVSNRTIDHQITTYADGEWHVAIIDMTTLSFEGTRVGPETPNTAKPLLESVQGKTWANFSYEKLGFVPYGWNSYADSKFDIEYFGVFPSAESANEYVNGTTGIIFKNTSDFTGSSDTQVTAGEGFTNFDYKVGGSSGWIGGSFKASSAFSGADYKYMAIKYRYEASAAESAALSLFRKNIKGTDSTTGVSYTISSRSQDGQIATVADGEWQIAVIDLTSLKFEAQRYDKNTYPDKYVGGEKSWADYTYQEFSIMGYGWTRPEAGAFDIGYIGLFKTEDDAKAYTGETKLVDNTEGYTYNAARLELVSKIKATDSLNSKYELNEAGYVTMTSVQTNGTAASRLYIPLGDDFDLNAHKYFAIKYRYNSGKLTADMQLMRNIKTDEDNTLSRVKDKSFETVTDGDGWQTLVIDLTTVEFDNEKFIGKTWSEHALNGIYLMPWGGSFGVGNSVDIEVLGFSDTENNARAIVGLEPVSEEENNTPADGGNGSTTAPETTNTEADATETSEEETKKGCGSSLALGGAAAVISVSAAAVTLFRKKKFDC